MFRQQGTVWRTEHTRRHYSLRQVRVLRQRFVQRLPQAPSVPRGRISIGFRRYLPIHQCAGWQYCQETEQRDIHQHRVL